MNEQFNVYGVEGRYNVPQGGDWLDYIKPAPVIPDLAFRLHIADEIAAMQEQVAELTRQRDDAIAGQDALRETIWKAWRDVGRDLAEEITAAEMVTDMASEINELHRDLNTTLPAMERQLKAHQNEMDAMIAFIRKIAGYRFPSTLKITNPTFTALAWFTDWAKEAKELLATYVEEAAA